jgi:hypothetical protein
MLSRDIRLTDRQLVVGREACRRRARELSRSITRAEEQQAAGAVIQRGTLDRHYEELRELLELERILEHNRAQLAREFAAKHLGI